MTEQASKITELQQLLAQREHERELYLACTGDNPNAMDYTKQMIEKQAEEIFVLKEKCNEYANREMLCEKKWTDLIRENEFNTHQVALYRA